MDPALLIDPVFWGDGSSVAMGAFDGDLPDEVDGSGLVFFQTSGSSGEPKWIGLTKNGLLISAAAVNGHLGVTEDSCWGLALPSHHVGGFGVVARAFEAGCGHVVFPGRWDAGRFRDWVAVEGVSHVSLVPTQVHDLVVAGLTAPGGLVAVVAGGGRLAEETGRGGGGGGVGGGGEGAGGEGAGLAGAGELRDDGGGIAGGDAGIGITGCAV
jgi:O-succinylbenzoic acid--CoA ligase